MSAMSNYLEEAVLNQFFRGTTPVYLAIYITDPTDNDTGTEISSNGGYARQPITFTTPAQSGGKAVIQNATKVDFATASAPWGTATHIGIRNSAVGGNLLAYAALEVAKTVNVGDQISFDLSQISFSLN